MNKSIIRIIILTFICYFLWYFILDSIIMTLITLLQFPVEAHQDYLVPHEEGTGGSGKHWTE